MLITFPRMTLLGGEAKVLATALLATCRPRRIVAPDHADSSIIIEGVTYRFGEHDASIWGPWWPKETSAPVDFFRSTFKDFDLSMEMPTLAEGTMIEIHVLNVNPAARWVQLGMEAVFSTYDPETKRKFSL